MNITKQEAVILNMLFEDALDGPCAWNEGCTFNEETYKDIAESMTEDEISEFGDGIDGAVEKTFWNIYEKVKSQLKEKDQ